MAKFKLLVTAGPTREMLDPVRFLSNVSTGHMGYAVAREARKMGCDVTLISGPTALVQPRGIKFVAVTSAQDMKRAIARIWSRADGLIMTAAVCDYTPAHFSRQKIKRVRQKTVHFKRTPDILKYFGARKHRQLTVGFCLETENVMANAKRKLRGKNLDYIVANWYRPGHNPFGTHQASMVLLGRGGARVHFPGTVKSRTARRLLRVVLAGRGI